MKFLVLVASLALTPPPAAAETYVIHGSTADELKREMRQKGPKGFWGYTNASYRWRFNYTAEGAQCRITSATVTEEIVVTLPVWGDKDRAPACLQRDWERMLRLLTAHEHNHRDKWQGTRERIRAKLLTVTGACNVAAMELAANAAGSAEVAKTQALQVQYDRETNHGQSEGVTLNDCR